MEENVLQSAPDAELQALGPDACPAGSLLGTGTTQGIFYEPFAHGFVIDNFKHTIYVMNGAILQAELESELENPNEERKRELATEAEFQLGAGRQFQSLIGVFWGTGVGGGIVLDGKPWLGRGAAGEIGHMVVKRGGAKCPCGRKGCMEAYAGRSAMEAEARRQHEEGAKTDLFKLMRKHEKPRLTSGIWERALDHGDDLAEKLIDRAIEALGTGVASAVNLLDPEAVIIGGGLGVRFGERYMDPLTAEMDKHLFVNGRPPAIRVAALGDLGGAIGASLLFAPN